LRKIYRAFYVITHIAIGVILLSISCAFLAFYSHFFSDVVADQVLLGAYFCAVLSSLVILACVALVSNVIVSKFILKGSMRFLSEAAQRAH
jgi:hypothetical protein